MKETVTILTGASKGLGKAISQQIMKKGGKVIGIGRNESQLKELQSQFKDSFHYIAGDLINLEFHKEILEFALSKFDHIDCLINNAGYSKTVSNFYRILKPIERLSEIGIEEFKKYFRDLNFRIFDLNVFSVLNLTQLFIPHLRKSNIGNIVFVSSGASINAYSGWGGYCSSKAAVNIICETIALEENSRAEDGKVSTLAIRPGSKSMDPSFYNKFVELKESGNIVPPDVPAKNIANLSFKKIAQSIHGKFVQWDDELLK